MICSFDAARVSLNKRRHYIVKIDRFPNFMISLFQAAKALIVHEAILARALPRETAGLLLSLCDGTFSPNALADSDGNAKTNKKDDEKATGKTDIYISLLSF